MLGRLQRGIEQLYRIDTRVDVDDFLIDAEARDQLGVSRAPREQLLVSQTDETVEIGLFVDRDSLANLERNDPSRALGDHNLGDFLLAIEGVSHFVYLVWRAAADRPVSPLELELQAEVDKYVTCLLTADGDAADAARLHRRLFEQFAYEPDLDAAERDRYRAANSNAARYSASLQQRFIARNRIGDMLAELRQFYRLPLAAKLAFIDSR